MLLAERIARFGNKIVSLLTAILIILLLTYGLYSLWDIYRINHNAFISDELLKYKPGQENGLGFDALRELNPDVKAWITIDNTHIDYPILQGKDNMEYVNKDPFGEFALSGSIFLSTKNASDFSDIYNMTYGHHMENGAMFGDLTKMLDLNYLKEHTTGTLYVPDKTYSVKLYAALNDSAYETRIYNLAGVMSDMEGFQTYVKANATSYIDQGVKSTDKIIALSTCMSATTNGRVVVFGTLTETEKEVQS